MIHQGYRGNINLQRIGVAHEWTPEMVAEWLRCQEDPIYFIETYVKIVNADGKLVNFKLYFYQKAIILSYVKNRNTITCCSRQSGKSTATAGFILWFILFNNNHTAAIMANKGDVALEIMGRIQFAYENLPKWLQMGIREWNKGNFILENGSKVLAAATSKTGIRGFSIQFLFIDEVARIENWDEFYTSVSQTLSSGQETKIGMVSTPKGLNHFWEFWNGAQKKINGFNPIFVTWRDVPGRDEAWKQHILQQLNFDYEKFAVEHECEFMGSSGTLIAGWKLKQMTAETPEYEKEGLKKFEEPIKDHIYAIIADVSRGKGLDYSAFSLIDITMLPYRQVCTFRNNLMAPYDYAEYIFHTAKSYNNAYILVETNDIGGQVADSLRDTFEYEGVLYTESSGRAGKQISFGFGKGKTELGIRTTVPVRNIGCSILKLLIEQDKLIIKDSESINELRTFSRKGVKYEAEAGKHDDLVMGLVLFGWLSDQRYFRELTDINTLSKLREKTDEDIVHELAPFGFIDDGQTDYENQNPNEVVTPFDNNLIYFEG